MKSKSKKNCGKTIKESAKVELTYSQVVHNKAINLSHGLKWGRGAAAKMEGMLVKALGKPCYYCGTKLVINNIQLDHKKPIKRPIKHTPRQFAILNSPQNLRFICSKCNFIKGTIPEKQYKKLLDFLNTDELLKEIVLQRLYTSVFIYVPMENWM